MDGEDSDRPRPCWAVRFSLTLAALNPGVLILLRWVRWVVVLVALWRTPGAVSSWLG
jgi:hypothetical protein